MPKPREMATITKDEGVAIATEIIQVIDSVPDLSGSDFGIQVRSKAVGVRAWLNDNNVFTAKHQKALHGWSLGVAKWKHFGGTVQ